MLWASIFATVATGSAVTTAISGDSAIAWVATVFAAFATAAAAYEKATDPSGTAAKHAMAQSQFADLVADFHDFIEYRADRMSEQAAEKRLDELEARRKRLTEISVAVEPAAHDAMEPGKSARAPRAAPVEQTMQSGSV